MSGMENRLLGERPGCEIQMLVENGPFGKMGGGHFAKNSPSVERENCTTYIEIFPASISVPHLLPSLHNKHPFIDERCKNCAQIEATQLNQGPLLGSRNLFLRSPGEA